MILAAVLSNTNLCFGLISLKLRILRFFFIFSEFPGLFAVNRSSVEVISFVSGSFVAKYGKNQHQTDATLHAAHSLVPSGRNQLNFHDRSSEAVSDQ